jgi:hypothetical protein
MDVNQDAKVEAAYNKLVEKAKTVGFTEQQLLFILGEVVEMVSPSLVDLQQQITNLTAEFRAKQKDESLKANLEELQKNA